MMAIRISHVHALLIITSSLHISCKERASTGSKAKQATYAEQISGTIGDISCEAFDEAKLKSSCIIDLTTDEGETLKLVSDDFYSLTDDVRSSLKSRHLKVFNDLILPIDDDNILSALQSSLGDGNFVWFFGDVPWLCHNKIAPAERCGVSFPLDYEAPKEILEQASNKIPSGANWSSIIETFPTLQNVEASAISFYATDIYSPVNAALRSRDPSKIEEWYPAIATISSGLRKLEKFQGLVYRGATLSEAKIDPYVDALNLQEPIQELAFMSTSYEEQGSFKKEVRFLVRSHSAAKIERFSRYAYEKEALFAPGTWFRVTGIQDGKDEEQGQEYLLIEMAELVVLE
jgi:hypothetical protein